MRAGESIKKKGSKYTDPKRAPCFLCGNPDGFETAYPGIKTDAGSFDIQVCRSCGLEKTDPFLDESELKRIYSRAGYRADDSTRFFAPLEKIIAKLKVRRCRRVERFSSKGAILDVGCGRGDFPALMASRGWKATGTELDERAASRGGKTGIDVRCGGLDSVRFPDGYFDAVTFWHVFEHLRDPVWTLKECARILKPGGLLLIAVPNTASLQARAGGSHWFHLDPPHHLYHYSLRNLKAFLNKAGSKAAFEVLSVNHFSLEYNPYGWFQSIYNLCGFPENMLYDFLRGKTRKNFYTRFCLALAFPMMPLVGALSIALSLIEAAIGMGGTIEIYARKKG